jgi:hypothetical protein
MVSQPDLPSQPTPPSPPEALVDRVRERLALAGAQFDRRAAAIRPRSRGRNASPLLGPSQPQADYSHRRERACLRAVFHELGDAHRTYRARTGNGVTAQLRAATTAFKQEPSLISLMPVAAFLDELGLLAW